LSKALFRTKPITNGKDDTTLSLRRCLGPIDLILLGIGAIIGAGIFVLTGIAAATKAGPAIVFSYMIAGTACAFAALAYAELAAAIGGCGSAYGYSYAGLGELPAWIIGWNLILEYGVSVSTVAVGWSAYVHNLLVSIGIDLPDRFLKSPFDGGLINLPALLIVGLVALLLCIGIKHSARFNALMVCIKLAVIALFIIIAIKHFNPINWHPFMPFGWNGVMGGAALIFFAYVGFDAVSTAAEEAIDPQRNLPIGLIVALVFCTLLYIVVSGLLTGIVPYATLNVASPIAYSLLKLGSNFAAGTIAIGAIAGLSTVILVMYYGLTRVFLAMSRDSLLPKVFAVLHPKTQTPMRIILSTGIIIAALAGFVPIHMLAEMVNIGTLTAFIAVCAGVIVLRHTQPNLIRPFKTPYSPIVPALGIACCCYLIVSLSTATWVRFGIWMLLGFLIYFGYSRSRSLLVSLKA
jgi:APA family basic amino acid/polyamine antiporter